MKLTVLQPAYFPSIDQIGKLLSADKVIWADPFYFHKHGNINRTRIKTIAGPKWLTIPVLSPGIKTPITEVLIDNHEDWQQRHRRSLELNYKNSAYYYFYCDALMAMLQSPQNALNPFLIKGLKLALSWLKVDSKIVASTGLPQISDRNERIVAWCEQTGCDTFIIEPFEKDLLDLEWLSKKGIVLKEFSIETVTYFQQYPDFYFPLSVLDLLFNEGEMAPALIKAKSILKKIVI